jgi:hypothetical protein
MMVTMPDSAPQSFIIKIWLEETAEEAGQATWRAHITHVPSGERRYLQTLAEISTFITPYLQSMGVTTEKRDSQDDQESAGLLDPVSRAA